MSVKDKNKAGGNVSTFSAGLSYEKIDKTVKIIFTYKRHKLTSVPKNVLINIQNIAVKCAGMYASFACNLCKYSNIYRGFL